MAGATTIYAFHLPEVNGDEDRWGDLLNQNWAKTDAELNNLQSALNNLSASKLDVGAKAADSNLLDGLDSTQFLRVNGRAVDSDKLDGLDSTQLLRSDASGTLNAGADTSLTVLSGDTGASTLSLHGVNQGTGRVYVGQSTTFGGGIEYNGDNTPVTSGAGSDYLALWRRAAGTDYWTARNLQSSNVWEFREGPTVLGNSIWHAGNDGAGSGLDADRLDGQDGSYYTDIRARLGFTPVQQSGGAHQGTNKVYIGWDGGSCRIQIDSTDMGPMWYDANVRDRFVQFFTGGQIGSYAFLLNASGGNMYPDGVHPGSSVRWSSTAHNDGGTPSGTWRCMSSLPPGSSGVFMRIS